MKMACFQRSNTPYYPQTHALIVNMPDNKRLDTVHPASSDGFSRAIDEAQKRYWRFLPTETQIMHRL